MLRKTLLPAVAAIVAIVVLTGAIGAALPRAHVATIEARLAQPPSRVFEAIADVAASTGWRSGLHQVEILSGADTPLRWRETSDFGTLTMVVEESDPPARLVTRIDDPDQPFGGSWIYELAPADDGTILRITERGEVYNPYFRFMSRFVFGHYRTLETYARDLARHLGSSAEPVRISAG